MMSKMKRRPVDADGMPIVQDKYIYYFVYFESDKIVPNIMRKAEVRMIYKYPAKDRLVWSCLMGLDKRDPISNATCCSGREVLNDQVTKRGSTAKRIALKMAQRQVSSREKDIRQINRWIDKTKKERV